MKEKIRKKMKEIILEKKWEIKIREKKIEIEPIQKEVSRKKKRNKK